MFKNHFTHLRRNFFCGYTEAATRNLLLLFLISMLKAWPFIITMSLGPAILLSWELSARILFFDIKLANIYLLPLDGVCVLLKIT